MNKNTLKTSLRMMIVLGALVLIAQGAAAAEDDAATTADDNWGTPMGAGLALGLAAIGAGFSQAAIGSAAVGMIAEDGIRDVERSRGLGDVYKRQEWQCTENNNRLRKSREDECRSEFGSVFCNHTNSSATDSCLGEPSTNGCESQC